MELLPTVPTPKLPPCDSSLSDRQKHFCDNYMMEADETKAKVAAGYNPNAHPLASPKVTNEIRQRQAERSHRTDIDSAWMLRRLADELTADMADLYHPNGDIKSIHDWPLIWRQGLILDITSTDIITKIKQSDRTKRLELIGRHVDVNAFREAIDITQTMTINVSSVENLTAYLERINPPVVIDNAI